MNELKERELERYISQKSSLECELCDLENKVSSLKFRIKELEGLINFIMKEETDDNLPKIKFVKRIVIHLHKNKLFIKTGYFNGRTFELDGKGHNWMTTVPTKPKYVDHCKVLCYSVDDILSCIYLLLNDKRPGNYSKEKVCNFYRRASNQFKNEGVINISIPIIDLLEEGENKNG